MSSSFFLCFYFHSFTGILYNNTEHLIYFVTFICIENKIFKGFYLQLIPLLTPTPFFFSPTSSLAARLMHKYNAHGATDITGFGLLGHANSLVKIQQRPVSFVIHNLPIIAKMAAVSKACGSMVSLLHGTAPETSGNH